MVLDEPLPDTLHLSAGENVGAREPGEENLRGATTFEITHHESPDESQGQAVAKYGENFEPYRKNGKEEQRKPSHHDRRDEAKRELTPRDFRANLDAHILRNTVAADLGGHEDGLGHELLTKETQLEGDFAVGRRTERFAKGIHTKVGRKGSRYCIQRKRNVRRSRQPTGNGRAGINGHKTG